MIIRKARDKQDEVLIDLAFAFTKGYYSWMSSIFFDVRDSSNLFADEDKEYKKAQ